MSDYCKVIPQRNGLLRIGKQGVRPLQPGEMLYYIWHEKTDLYYKTCYVSQEYALKQAYCMRGPRSMSDVAQSWVPSMKHCSHSFKTED